MDNRLEKKYSVGLVKEHVFLLAANFKSDGMTSHEQYRAWLPSTVENGVLLVRHFRG